MIQKYILIFFIIFMLVPSLHSQSLLINWQNCYGGTNDEGGVRLANSSYGYSLFCSSNSNNQNIPSNHGAYDYWVLTIDIFGNIIWTKTFGGIGDEIGSDFKPTPDGGFILFGTTFTLSGSGQVIDNHGASDYWIVKIDSLGNIEWKKCLGGSFTEQAYEVDLTKDGGYICVGYSSSYDGNLTVNYGNFDAWIVRLDNKGIILWQKSFGGSFTDWGICVHSTSDGGAIVGGLIGSADGNIQCQYHGNDDAWVLKLDSAGNIEWQKCFGGTLNESFIDIELMSNGDYILTGQTSSNDGDVTGNHGNADLWVVKIDHWGNLVWQRCFGGSDTEYGLDIKNSSDGNYFIGGFTYSNDGDVFGNHSLSPFDADIWVIKITSDGELIWQKCLGGIGDEGLKDIIAMPEGRMMLLGWTDTDDDSDDVKCNRHGSSTWDVWLISVIDSTYIGINEISDEIFSISAFPNPANRYINFIVKEPNLYTNTYIKIFNKLGQLLFLFKPNKDDSVIHFDCHDLPSGSYYFNYCGNHINKYGRIMISH